MGTAGAAGIIGPLTAREIEKSPVPQYFYWGIAAGVLTFSLERFTIEKS